MMSAYIKAISYYLPETVLTNEELGREFPDWDVQRMARKLGIKQRHIAEYDQTAGDMAERAARRLFEEYGVNPGSIDFVMLCTQSPDYVLPPTACVLQDRLGIPRSAGAFDFNLGCSGCVYGLALAKGLIAGGMARSVLLLTAETYSKYLNGADRSNRSIFGDGAAACLIGMEGFAEIGEFVLGTDGSGADKLIVRTGGARHRVATGMESMDDVGRVRYDDYLYMDGGGIFNFTLEAVPAMVRDVLAMNHIEQGEVDCFVLHQANEFMLETIRKVCGIQKERFVIDLADTGNTVSSTVLICLKRCIESGRIERGMNVMVGGFGVGLSLGGVLLKF